MTKSKYRHVLNTFQVNQAFDDIDARLTALEGQGVAPNASDEDAAIARVREMVKVGKAWHVQLATAGHLLNAYDRVTQERDEARAERDARISELHIALNGRNAFMQAHEEQQKRIAELEGELAERADAKPITSIPLKSSWYQNGDGHLTKGHMRGEPMHPVYAHPPAVTTPEREDTKPLGWVCLDANSEGYMYNMPCARAPDAVPVYAHPPAVTTQEIKSAIERVERELQYTPHLLGDEGDMIGAEWYDDLRVEVVSLLATLPSELKD